MTNRIGILDQVIILTTKNVSYLSAPPDYEVKPDGPWIVSSAIDDELMLCKNNVVIKIPAKDVFKVLGYNIDFLNDFRRFRDGKE